MPIEGGSERKRHIDAKNGQTGVLLETTGK
jgi:hypothetical protein